MQWVSIRRRQLACRQLWRVPHPAGAHGKSACAVMPDACGNACYVGRHSQAESAGTHRRAYATAAVPAGRHARPQRPAHLDDSQLVKSSPNTLHRRWRMAACELGKVLECGGAGGLHCCRVCFFRVLEEVGTHLATRQFPLHLRSNTRCSSQAVRGQVAAQCKRAHQLHKLWLSYLGRLPPSNGSWELVTMPPAKQLLAVSGGGQRRQVV
jgi:hypothetical protein